MIGSLRLRSALAPRAREHSVRRWLVLLLAAGVHALSTSTVQAEPAWANLDWDPPRSFDCPPRVVLERDVEQALGRSVFTRKRTARLKVSAQVEQADSEISVRLDARSATGKLLGTRELRGPSCAILRDSIGLVLTLLVEYAAGPPEPDVEVAPGVQTGALLSVLPRAAFGLGPALSLRLSEQIELHTELTYWLPVELETEGGKHAVVHGVSLAPRLCPWLAGTPQSLFDLRVCGGARLGVWIVAQTWPHVADLHVRLLAQALLEMRGALRLGGGTQLELAVGPVLTLQRTSLYAVQDDGTQVPLYRMPVLGVFVGLGLII